ncbi:MAG: GIY-YIG nuclease family protein [Proteobacteria bacterium]|nr:GIY-YIG nuclease family protein [Pseudomonadota bacterium]MBU1449891.1 GIY-YIG nuclease family protein [Pseudomonadota bacterium]
MGGQTIRTYLIDGDPTGIITSEIMNWTGKIIAGPRTLITDLLRRWEAEKTGIYILKGQDPQDQDRMKVYVGEAENIKNRLITHNNDENKDFWSYTYFVISKDDNLTKAHVRYLESLLISILRESAEVSLSNSTSPDVPSIPESDQSDMEHFLNQMKIILPLLEFSYLQTPKSSKDRQVEAEPSGKIITPTTTKSFIASTQASPTFCWAPDEAYALAEIINGQLTIIEGSTALKEGKPSWTSYRTLRDKFEREGTLVPDDNNKLLRFTRNTSFPSPSAAAAMVYGGNVNGPQAWKIEGTEKTFRQWQEEEMQKAGLSISNGNSNDPENG